MKYFVGMDLGTQSSKGMLFSPEGAVVAQATAQYIPDFPRPNWCEQDVSVWTRGLRDILARLMADSGVPAREIGMIAFASQCGGMVPVAADGVPLAKCILWLDRRAEDQCQRVREQISDDEAYELVGAPISSSLRALKIMWLRENDPEAYERAVAYLEPGEYMVYYLTGELVGDYAHASITGLYDVAKREWSPRMFGITGIPREKMIALKAAGEVAGRIRPEAAAYLGLDGDTRVVVGTGDQHAASIGSGLVKPGNILNIMGTAEIIAVASPRVAYDPCRILRPHLHVDPAYWQVEQGALISGAAVRWYRDNLARVSYDEMNHLAAGAPAGSDGLLFFSGLSGATSPVVNGAARGIFFGLTMSHTLGHLTRAVYEGCACGFRDSIESLRSMGLDGGEIIAGGGGVKSPVWMQIKADLVGKVIRTLRTSDATPLGAGMLAGAAQGNFADFQQAADRLVEYGAVYEPNPANRGLYDELYGSYRELYFTAEPLFERCRRL